MNKQYNKEESENLVEILKTSSAQYKEGKHCSTEQLKERLESKFKKIKEV